MVPNLWDGSDCESAAVGDILALKSAGAGIFSRPPRSVGKRKLFARIDLHALGVGAGHGAAPLGGTFLVGVQAGIRVGVLL